VFHFEGFARDSADPPRNEDFRVLVGIIAETFEDVASLPAAQRAAILNPNSYAASQAYANGLRAAGSNGVAYPSVRHTGGQCIGAFRPRAVRVPHQERRLKYRWNGERVDRYFDYALDEWIGL
jgi:hypothetical protein